MPFVEFNLDIILKYGQALYLANSQSNWVVDRMCRMNCIQDSLWQISYDVFQNPFEYKYAIGDYFLQSQSYIQWEKGPNRILNWKNDIAMTIKNKWEQRKIQFLLQTDSQASVVILMSNHDFIQKKLKNNKDMKNNQKIFHMSYYIDINKIILGIEVQYYLLTKGKYPNEFISKPFTFSLDDQQCFHSKDLQFTKISS
ncbi:unnamed protein product [Paramecium pentaurelia]|uniref:CBM20 domain-containing protein n=1 Tax=Paramecium pentaurelia TaxID=43138 RepID=A0A8S1TXA2_9CILI|nr:unnamed protein product [Paramecium pentaurelia]